METDDRQETITTIEKVKYPRDCYSFLSLHSPFKEPRFFLFGFSVWAFQFTFYLLMVFRVASKWSTDVDTDNPDKHSFFKFIPSNVGVISRITQFWALMAYCIFADDCLKDVIRAVELFPRFERAKEGDSIGCMVFSCVLRFSQGFMASIVVVMLVIQTSDVIEIILNFTAVNFISGYDEAAFELAHWGKFGQKFKDEAYRIRHLNVPECAFRRHDEIRYRYIISSTMTVMIAVLCMVSVSQLSPNKWLSKRLRVQFKDGSLFKDFNGCYDLDLEGSKYSQRRRKYTGFEANQKIARFGYCEDNRKWYLYAGDAENACDATDGDMIANSHKLYTYDINAAFNEPWYSSSGRPLELYFFEEGYFLKDEQCESFLGDGICDDFFNSAEYDYDEGDCCASTCDEPLCGIGSLKTAFDTDIVNGNGYRNCWDHNMQPITIRLNDVYTPEVNLEGLDAFFDTMESQTKEALMLLDCDDKNVLMVSINEHMKNKTETVFVADGANCVMTVKNSTLGSNRIWYIDYTIFHGDKSDVTANPIVMAQGDSFIEEVSYFQRIPQCYFDKLEGHIDFTTIYTGTDSSNLAVHWLMKNSSEFSNCELDEFLERYALTTINFAAPIVVQNSTNDNLQTQTDDQGLWITTERHCIWEAVGCKNGNIVTELNYEDIVNFRMFGTIPSEIGLLTNLVEIGMGFNDLYSTIPSEIGRLSALTSLSINNNNLTGSIPTEVGLLKNLNIFGISNNHISGTLPSEIGGMTSLNVLWVYVNSLEGSIPSEIGHLTALKRIVMDGNRFTGSLPSTLEELKLLDYFGLSYNSFTGSIPSELGKTAINTFIADVNSLTGSVPSELLDLFRLDVFGNELSNLIPIDDYAICSDPEGEHYCNCGYHCLSSLNLPGNKKCECEDAQACCTTLLDTNIPCVLCPYGFQNPDYFISAAVGTCKTFSFITVVMIKEFGTPETCNLIREATLEAGCICNDTPPPYPECIICEFGFENPDFFLESYGDTCNRAQFDISQNPSKYASEHACSTAGIAIKSMGCKCNDGP